MDLQIFTNEDRTEFAAMRVGDRSIRARTTLGVHYPVMVGEYKITATSDLAIIDARSREALELHVVPIDNCCEHGAEFECCNCLATIEKGEMHGEMVLYAGDIEIGMISAFHNDCEEV